MPPLRQFDQKTSEPQFAQVVETQACPFLPASSNASDEEWEGGLQSTEAGSERSSTIVDLRPLNWRAFRVGGGTEEELVFLE